MKKLFSLLLLLSTLAVTVSAQNTYITPVAGRGARVTINEPNPSTTQLRYTLVNSGHTFAHTPASTSTDSCVLRVDTASCELGIKRVNGTATGYMVLDSISSITAARKLSIVTRLSTPLGTNVASANNLAVGYNSSKVQITGTTTINLIDTTGFVGGDEIELWFNGSLTVADSVARSGVYAPLNLSGGSNFSATKNDVLKLTLRREVAASASEWWESGRVANAD